MTCTIPHTRQATPAVTLRDFVIQGAAEIGECNGAQAFRAIRRQDSRPVLLHKFRPAAPMATLGSLVTVREPPDFTKPFVTRFSDLFAVAGSAYLVEPLPLCTSLSDVWRHVLQKRPTQAVTVMTVLIRQAISVSQQLRHQGKCHGALDVQNIVLAPAGCFGVLTAHVECEKGMLWLRKDPENPPRSDSHSLVDVLGSLLDLDVEVAALQKTLLRVPVDIHRKIRSLLHAIQPAPLSLRRPVPS